MNMKMFSLITLALIIFVASVVVVFVAISNQREKGEILAEIVIWPNGGGGRGGPIYYFVVRSDGTLIGYHGRSRSDSGHDRTRNFVRSIQEREHVGLSSDDFLYISELISRIVLGADNVEGYLEGYHGSTHVMFLQNGYFYENSSFRSRSLQNLLRMLFRLTSISIIGY